MAGTYLKSGRRHSVCSLHNKRHLRDMAEPEINQFLNYLVDTQKVTSSTQTQTLSAVLFLYKEVLQREIGSVHNLHWAKKTVRLPVVSDP